MKLGTSIFVCYAIIFIACFYYPINWIVQDLRIRYLEGIEDSLVDYANILSSFVAVEMEKKDFNTEKLYKIFENVKNTPIKAKIYVFNKDNIDVGIYITDRAGIVIFDSESRENIGRDYSKWRDVILTLKGKYGARTTRINPDDPGSSVMFVGAPIILNGEIAGVLTVSKPYTNVNLFLKSEKPRIIKVGLISGGVAIFLGLLVSIWLTKPIRRLISYANDVKDGKPVELPKLGRSELKEMGIAIDKMREALEGKKYVENYVQTLTHEIKSPISAIKGAAEILQEDMPPEKRARFLSNILNESNRIANLIDRMLLLSTLENKKTIENWENVSINSLINMAIESKEPMIIQKNLQIKLDITDEIQIKGDSFLLFQAISNIIQNAIDFSPQNNEIYIKIKKSQNINNIEIIIEDNGPGIPEYATEKVFDKFFSLQRPDTGKKSTGLGLNFVKEVAKLHKGMISLENKETRGLRAVLTLIV